MRILSLMQMIEKQSILKCRLKQRRYLQASDAQKRLFDKEGKTVGVTVSRPGATGRGIKLHCGVSGSGRYNKKDPNTLNAFSVNENVIGIGIDDDAFLRSDQKQQLRLLISLRMNVPRNYERRQIPGNGIPRDMQMNRFNISFSAATMVGSRSSNQDIFLVNSVISDADTTEKQYFEGVCSTNKELCAFVVCDGIGSYEKSGFAARAAMLKIRELVEEYNNFVKADKQPQTEAAKDASEALTDADASDIVGAEASVNIDAHDSDEDAAEDAEEKTDLRAWVIFALEEAKKAMLDFCRENNCRGASSTISMLIMREDEYIFANIGDSPCYLRNGDGRFRELSFKHNLASYKRAINADWLESDERVLLYHLGDEKNEIILTANIVNSKINPGDAFIVCSDGVSSAFEAGIIGNKLFEQTPSYKFVSEAARAEYADNCTAITVYVEQKTPELRL